MDETMDAYFIYRMTGHLGVHINEVKCDSKSV